MTRASTCLASLVLALSLSACASSAKYPSLVPRAAERITGTAQVVEAQPAPAPAPAPPSANFTARLAQLVEQARDAKDRFASQRPRTEKLLAAAGGAAVASEGWSVASIALADLTSTRSDLIVPLAEIDRLYASESVAAAETGDFARADAAAEAERQVDAWLDEQDAILARLGGMLRS